LDRLFLRGLVEELRPEIIGRRIRTAFVVREQCLVTLGLAPPRAATLAVSFLRHAAGPYLLPSSRPRGEGVATAGLRKLASSRIAAVEISERDRIVTLSFESRRLSGRAERLRLVLEALAARSDLYLVDGESEGVLEVFSSSRARLGAGDRYHAPPPPPGAGAMAASASEIGERLRRAGEGGGRAALLAATGATPLLVREIEWLAEREGMSPAEAFMTVRSRLLEKRPFVYVPAAPSPGRPTVVSPIPLASAGELLSHEHPSFSSAMAEAVAVEGEARRISALRSRIESAVGRRLDRLRRLKVKLESDRSSPEEPAELRRRGELLLAGLTQARRGEDGRTVVLPDLFDPRQTEVELEVDPRLSLPKNAERFFHRARKAERAEVELGRRLEEVAKEIAFWEGFECDLRDAAAAVELEALECEALDEGLSLPLQPGRRERVRLSPAPGPRSFRSHRGREILVGRSGRGNDALTFDVAKPHDLWFHASGVAGAHVVLRTSPPEPADEREIREAAELAAYFSKARGSTSVDVMVTERRYVSRIKGAPRGLVKVASAPETRTLRVAPRGPEREEGRR
jgi:predicted ribosome quality control (RQC) complex YloA/Tae2 family protein